MKALLILATATRLFGATTPHFGLNFPSVSRDFLVLQASLGYAPHMLAWLLCPGASFSTGKALAPFSGHLGALLEVLRQHSLDRYEDLIGQQPMFLQGTRIGRRPCPANLENGVSVAPGLADHPSRDRL